ncbi:MAG: HPr family phosphocarrier protein [Bacillota bacterium]|nr:HPr family phosphocarrier protein [Bacillota bacterium]
MVSQKIVVKNKSGLHARPATTFISEAKKFKSKLTINKGDKSINGTSIITLLSAGISCGSEIELVLEGEDEKEALKALAGLIESGCGE